MFLFKRDNGIYYLVFEDQGKQKRISTGKRFKQEALEFLRNFNEQMRQREEQQTASISIKDFAGQFLKFSESVHTLKTRKAFMVTFGMLERHFGNVKLTEITTRELERFFTQRIKEASTYAARRDYINLSSAFNKAVRDKQLRENPCKGIGKIRIPEKLPLFFSPDEFQVLIRAIDKPEIRHIVEFAGNTGLRQMEILTLRWEQVNLADGILILDNRTHTTKSKKIRTVPLNRRAQWILAQRKELAETEFVFTVHHKPITQNSITKIFKKYVVRAKLNPKASFHTLRHSFASWLVMRGVSLYEVQRLLGHSSPSVTQLYAHLTNGNLAATVEKLLDPTN
jgi:integrase